MSRVFHLIDHSPDYQTASGVEQLTRGGDGVKLTVGRGGDFSNVFTGILHLRNKIETCNLIHAWGDEALTIAAVGCGKPIVYCPTRFPDWRDLRKLRAVMSVRDIHVICPTDTMRRRFVTNGVPIERCHMIRPGVDFSRINRRRNDELRSKLGFDKDDFVLLAAGESIRGANHHAAILASSVLNAFDPKYKLLVWGKGPLAESERIYGSQMLPTKYMAIATDRLGAEISFEQLLPATDAVLITANAPVPPLAIATCMAAGLPIVAVVSETISEMLEDRHSCLMVGKPTSRMIARRVLDLLEDSQLQWSISDTAKTEAFEFFTMTRFVEQFKAIYEQIAKEKKVEVPQQQPGAGARFLGRA